MIIPTLDFERKLWRKGYSNVCGVDEVGRGAFAGPVCAGAVIFPKNFKFITGIADSKLLNFDQRQKMDSLIKKHCLSWAVSEISVSVINKVGIGKATQMAFRKVIKLLEKKAEFVLIDAFYIKHFSRKYQLAIIKGDQVCASISAASIIAKVYRDKLMMSLAKNYPDYDFFRNKGYGTKLHREALAKYGLSKVHRLSFNLEKFCT